MNGLAYMFHECDVISICNLSPFEIFQSLISAAAHDMDHPGTNNFFETKNQSKLAILYNDQSVLENHHAASFFFTLENTKHDCNIFKNFTPKEQGEARKQILENILWTDNAKHGAINQ